MSSTNVWHLRRVAETSSKPCEICYKATTSVLITPDKRDYFYTCQSHLSDRGFCSPIIDEAEAAAKKKKEDMNREIEIIKNEYEEKLKKKKKKKKVKAKLDKDKETDKTKGAEEKEEEDNEKDAEKEKNEKINAITSKQVTSKDDELPRIYALHKTFYQKRLDRLRNIEIAKRNQERLKSPTAFPSVPTNNLD